MVEYSRAVTEPANESISDENIVKSLIYNVQVTVLLSDHTPGPHLGDKQTPAETVFAKTETQFLPICRQHHRQHQKQLRNLERRHGPHLQ